ncbi:MAG: PKD domain-containing protein [Parachlamydiales bacterium]
MRFKLFSLYIISAYLFFTPLAAADWFAYAADKSNFQVITFDVTTETAGLPISGGRSEALAITPDAATLYVINQNVVSTVTVVNLATQTVINTISLNEGGVLQTPFSIAITPDGTTAYITAVDDSSVYTILKLDLASSTYTVIPISTNIQSNSVAISPDGSTIYLTQTSSILSMTTAGNVFGLPINVPGRSTRIALAPSGQLAYVTDMINNKVYEINLLTQTVSQTIPITPNAQPTNIAVSANGLWAYIANENVNYGTALNLSSYATVDIPFDTVPGNYTQQGVAISPDSQKAVFTHANSNTFTTVAVGTTNITQTSVTGFQAFVAITPDQAPIASFVAAPAQALSPTTFISTSTTNVGTIASYVWDFGDGTIITTTSNPVQHTYLGGGSYTVTLTVTNSGGTSTTQTFTGQSVSNNGGPSATVTQNIQIPDAPVSPIPLPPGLFLGNVIKNKFLNRTKYVLEVTWNPSPSGDVLFYQITLNGQIVAVIPSSSPLVYEILLRSKKDASHYKIFAINAANLVSTPVSIRIINE